MRTDHDIRMLVHDELQEVLARREMERRAPWLMRAFEWAMLFILGAFVVLYIAPLVGDALLGGAPSAPPSAAERSTPPPARQNMPPIQAPIVHPHGQLPPCGAVADTTTACEQDQAPTLTPEPTPQPWCEDVPAGAEIVPCQWRDAEAAKQLQEQTEQEALQLWQDMADQAIEQDLRAPPSVPTAEVPTECQNPSNARARASCELIKRGIIHPKG